MFKQKENYNIDDLRLIMKELRSEHGCPWDREQNHASISKNLLEESYEVVEAIDTDDMELLKEELGDVLLQIVFHSEMEEEKGVFDFDDVADGICKKLIYRHPHVFGNVNVSGTDEVLTNWEKLKSTSKGESTVYDSLVRIPKTLPALMRGEKVGKKAASAGFDFPDTKSVLESLESEIKELKLAILNENEVEIEEEFGDILFSACNLGRFLKKDSEKALTSATNKFIIRFRTVEEMALNSGRTLDMLPQETLENFWNKTKVSKQTK